MTGDRTHYHDDGCTPPHPAATLADALQALSWGNFGWTTLADLADEVLRLLRTGECDELNAAVTDAVAANPERYGLGIAGTWYEEEPGMFFPDTEPGPDDDTGIVLYRFARSEGADQEGRDDGD